MITPRQPEMSLKEIVKKPVSEWKNRMKNILKYRFLKISPTLYHQEKLYEQGSVCLHVGLGINLFGLFEKPPELENIFPDCFCMDKCRLLKSIIL